MQDSFVTANGFRTRLRRGGAGGVPLVLLHGLGGSLDDWDGTLAALSARREVVAIDLLGCGQSAKPRHLSYTPEVMRDHVLATLDAAGLGRVDLDGWSLGGRIAIDIAATVPERVRRLILTAPAGLGPDTILDLDAPWPRLLRTVATQPGASGVRIFGNAFRTNDPARALAFMSRRLRLLSNADLRSAFIAQLRTIVGPSGYLPGPRRQILAKLSRINAPTLAIWGRQDHFAPVTHAAHLRDRILAARLHLIDRCGHAPHLEYPDRYCTVIDDFLTAGSAQVH